MTMGEWHELRGRMATASKLPKPSYHMSTHGMEFAVLGIENVQQLEALFLEHVKRSDLEYYTYISTKKGTHYRMWVMIGMDNGVVALYNESEGRHWSITRVMDAQDYVGRQYGWWVKVEVREGKLRVQRCRKP